VAEIKTMKLGEASDAFAHGGNRLCFYHPEDRRKIIKVLRHDKLPQTKRRNQSFPRKLKPLTSFDDNIQEHKVYQQIENTVGQAAFQLIPRCYGFVDTDHGPGLVSELIVDGDGRVSLTLKQFVWQYGKTDALSAALDKFVHDWHGLGMPSRNLLLHNIVVQQQNNLPERLVAVDGLGWAGLVALLPIPRFFARHKALRKVNRLRDDIERLITKRENGEDWGVHGWLDEHSRLIPQVDQSSDHSKDSHSA
jgi:hypothetical protein